MTGTTPAKTLSDLAKDALDDAFKANIGTITNALTLCMVSAAGNSAEEQQCKDRYRNAMQSAKAVYQIGLDTIRQVFPPGS
ncbi:MAG: hypothetical protein JOZ83_02045 [Silvibacterium sp.]|nr:hypothetical protein [Silvibacterium sp.]